MTKTKKMSSVSRYIYPHSGVYTRLAPSPIHGVGVFAIISIPKGTYIFEGEDENIVWIDPSELVELPPILNKLYEDFSVERNGLLGCPQSFNRLSVPWYLNHSKDYNVICDEDLKFRAERDIFPGEELLIDYDSYNDPTYKF